MHNLKAIKAALAVKQAELGLVDDQILSLDSTLPQGTSSPEFDLLSQKREELEEEILRMRERVQLISAWDAFKNGDWSEDVKGELKSLDQQFANIADGAEAAGSPMGDPLAPTMPPAPMDALAPEAPLSPEAPMAPEAPATDDPSLAGPVDDAALAPTDEASVSEPALDAPTAAPVAAPTASVSENTNHQSQNKKGSSPKEGDTHMANENKPSLKDKLAEVKTKREAHSKEAKVRVASAWTIAKTMLPTAPADTQLIFAKSLMANTTKALTAALRQTAINAHYTKVAETFKEVHKVELNDLLEDPSMLNTEKKAVEKELKGEAKSAGKVADDRKECGEQPKSYDDGRNGSEPKDMDASKAADRTEAGTKPGETINVSEGKSASAKTAACGNCGDCEGCKKTAAPEDGAPMAPPAEAAPKAPAAPEAPAAPADEAPMAPPADMPPAPVENPDSAAGEILTDEKKMVVEEKIDEAQEAIKALEKEILEEGNEDLDMSETTGEGEAEIGDEESEEGDDLMGDMPKGEEGHEDGEGHELDLNSVFDNDNMDEKISALANEGEEHTAAEDDFFAPTSAENMESNLDESQFASMDDFFSMQGAEADPLASLMASAKTAEQVAGMEVIPSSTGEAAAEFANEEMNGEDRDMDTDHSEDLWAEAINIAGEPEQQGAKRMPQDSQPKLEAPKAAKKAATLRRVRPVVASEKMDIGRALFGDEE